MPHKDPKVRKAYLEEYLKRPETIKRRKEYRERNREKSNSNHKIYYQNNKKIELPYLWRTLKLLSDLSKKDTTHSQKIYYEVLKKIK